MMSSSVDRVWRVSSAPTVITCGSLAGESMPPGPNSPSLPAAATTTMPLFQAASTAIASGSYSAGAVILAPSEMFITPMS